MRFTGGHPEWNPNSAFFLPVPQQWAAYPPEGGHVEGTGWIDHMCENAYILTKGYTGLYWKKVNHG